MQACVSWQWYIARDLVQITFSAIDKPSLSVKRILFCNQITIRKYSVYRCIQSALFYRKKNSQPRSFFYTLWIIPITGGLLVRNTNHLNFKCTTSWTIWTTGSNHLWILNFWNTISCYNCMNQYIYANIIFLFSRKLDKIFITGSSDLPIHEHFNI